MRDITRYFIHVVQLIRGATGVYGTGTDQYGDPVVSATPAAGLALNARVEWDRYLVRFADGREVTCNAKVFLPHRYQDPITGAWTQLDIGPEDRLLFEGREHMIVQRRRQEGWSFSTDHRSHWELDTIV
jgi:hypothetical protein